MSLRLALFLISLIVLAIIGFYCNKMYRIHHSKKRFQNLFAPDSIPGTEQLDSPYLPDNTVSDLAQAPLIIPDAVDDGDVTEDIKLNTTLDSIHETKIAAQQSSLELLPVYNDDCLITDHVGVVVNCDIKVKKLKKIIHPLFSKSIMPIKISLGLENETDFIDINKANSKDNVKNIKIACQLKCRAGHADAMMIDQYEENVAKLAKSLDCEYKFALTSAQSCQAAEELDNYIKNNEMFIILYIIAEQGKQFTGGQIKKAVSECGFSLNDNGFFEYFSTSSDGIKKKVLNLANMYKPGTFDANKFDQVQTSGLCVFMIPDLHEKPVQVLDTMKIICKQLAVKLDGSLLSQDHNPFDHQNETALELELTRHLKVFQEKGIYPGSELAHRLLG